MASSRFVRALACSIALASVPAVAAENLQKLSWLSGCWTSDGGEAGSGEHWLPLAGGSLVGVGRTIKAGKTISSELMRIETDPDGTLLFTAVPLGQATTVFKQLRMDASEVVFENLQNDFPHRVAYRRVDDDHVHARIEGVTSKGVARTIPFPLTRVSCDAQLAQRTKPAAR